MNRNQEIKVYTLHLIKNGYKEPVEIRTKIRGENNNFVQYFSNTKEDFISSKEFYDIPEGYKCILIQ